MKLNIYPNLIPGALREEVKAKSGDTVSLPCIINREECGDFHSIKWYKENRRVYVYSPIAEFTKAEGELLDRYVIVHLSFYSSYLQMFVNNYVHTKLGLPKAAKESHFMQKSVVLHLLNVPV